MDNNYRTLSQALDDLRRQGFTEDFNLQPHCIHCAARQIDLHPEDFKITGVYRFEGQSDPDYNEVIYAIEGKNGLKGVLVDAYGAYSDSLSTEMLAKLRLHPN